MIVCLGCTQKERRPEGGEKGRTPHPQGYVASALDVSLMGGAAVSSSSAFLDRTDSTTLCRDGSRYKATVKEGEKEKRRMKIG